MEATFLSFGMLIIGVLFFSFVVGGFIVYMRNKKKKVIVNVTVK